MMIKQLEENVLSHSCRKKGDRRRTDEDVEQYTVLELFDHLLNVCLKKQNICPNCEVENDSIP